MSSLLKQLPTLSNIIVTLQQVNIHSLEEWENKVEPALFNLSQYPEVKSNQYMFDMNKINLTGNDSEIVRLLGNNLQPAQFKNPDINIYSYSGLKDLGILRRLKEYPDETDRTEIEAFWAAECVENKSLLLINSEFKTRD